MVPRVAMMVSVALIWRIVAPDMMVGLKLTNASQSGCLGTCSVVAAVV